MASTQGRGDALGVLQWKVASGANSGPTRAAMVVNTEYESSMNNGVLFDEAQERVELKLAARGYRIVVGCDEAGRGPLAGPVVAASVVFRDCKELWRARDSKSLTERQRETLFAELTNALLWSVALQEPADVDRLNIRVASLTAMCDAVQTLQCEPDMILVDGRDRLPEYPQSRAIIDGDALVATIGAASIIAKVTRDHLMREYHVQYPAYGFDRHFGYPTAAHRQALKVFGPCPIHRRSYRGVRELVEAD